MSPLRRCLPEFVSVPLRACGSGLTTLIVVSLVGLSAAAVAQEVSERQDAAGPLDTPLPAAIVDKSSGPTPASPARVPGNTPSRVPEDLQPGQAGNRGAASLKAAVRQEQETLEQLPRGALNNRAQNRERGAQIALGVSFARESALLGFSVAAANDAASDAARWYHRAASQGFPGAPSLDIAGVRHYPIRAARNPVE